VKRRRLRSQKPPPVIDVWWVVHDGGLMLALAALLKRHVLWRKATIRVFVVFNPTAGISLQQTGARMSWYLQRIRIDARVIPIMVPSEVIADAWHDRTLDMEKRRQLLAELK
ncbi:SLC12A6, partial [Symbiodinium sp. KB8]